MNKQIFETRREKLRSLLHKANLEALLVTLDANRYYLSGFELKDAQPNESSGCLIITLSGDDWLCTDQRYHEAACRLWDNNRVFIYSGSSMPQINALLKDHVAGNIGFEARNINHDDFELVSPNLSMCRADGMVESLRMIKDYEEIKLLESACTLNHQLMEWVPGVLAEGRTEKQIAWDIEQFFRNHGAEELSFASIVAEGPNSALPHAEPGDARLGKEDLLLVDVGCRLNRYCSDQTRTFWYGNSPAPEFLKALDSVKTAQQKAIEAIKPGVAASDVYKVAMAHFESLGVEKQFTHGLGHGIGLQTHEAPSLNPRSPAILREGMVVTVEPGLYYPGLGGVRWEYMVLVTEEGSRVL